MNIFLLTFNVHRNGTPFRINPSRMSVFMGGLCKTIAIDTVRKTGDNTVLSSLLTMRGTYCKLSLTIHIMMTGRRLNA